MSRCLSLLLFISVTSWVSAFLLPSTPSSSSSSRLSSSFISFPKSQSQLKPAPLSPFITPSFSALPPSSFSFASSTALSSSDASEFWQGEWVCADCGYIYETRNFDFVYFEEQKRGFKCPQCSAPRRRFAKKVGDKVGITNDGGDSPIIAFSLIGGLATLAFGVYAALTF